MLTSPFGKNVAVFVFALVASAGIGSSAITQEAKTKHSGHDKMMQDCAKACSDCQRACDSCASHCAHMLREGKKDHLAALMSCLDCSAICATASQSAARSGPFSKHICEACGDVCAACAVECEKMPNDAHMKACAEECRRCEKSCKDMVKHMGGK